MRVDDMLASIDRSHATTVFSIWRHLPPHTLIDRFERDF